MARPTLTLIDALKRTVKNLQDGAPYEWGHMGSCNCGNLAQELTKLSKKDIHEYAMRGRGDWNQQIMDFCPTSGMPMDLLIAQLLDSGLTREDLMMLEKLSDPEIIEIIPPEHKFLKHNHLPDVIRYFKAWVLLLESQLIHEISLTQLASSTFNETVTV